MLALSASVRSCGYFFRHLIDPGDEIPGGARQLLDDVLDRGREVRDDHEQEAADDQRKDEQRADRRR